MNEIIAITGMCGSGKTTAANVFKQFGYEYLRFGQVVMDELIKNHQEINENNERKTREKLRKDYGMGAFAVLNQPKINSLIVTTSIVIDGLYSFAEYKLLKRKYGDRLFNLAIYSPPAVRYVRLKNRQAVSDDKNVLFRPLTQVEAEERDYHEIEKADKGGPIAIADWTILNNDLIDIFIKDIKEFLHERRKI
ncbi:MAG: AAA family ATPase [Caldisericia bacterium]|nr:AAA family ATPase [Caldisericia bacterium]